MGDQCANPQGRVRFPFLELDRVYRASETLLRQYSKENTAFGTFTTGLWRTHYPQ